MIKLDIQMFASTNKTANYELPQFVGTDKPTWLGDFNNAMASIDAGMAENKSDIESMDSRVSSAESTASTASQNVATLTGRVNTLQTNVESTTTTANNAQSTATSALNTANSAQSTANTADSKANEVETNLNSFEREFNLTTTKTYSSSSSDVSVIGGNIYSGSVTIATNSTGSIFKLYGNLNIRCTANPYKITLNNTGISTDASYNINCVGFADTGSLQTVNVEVNNNQIVISTYIQSTSSSTVRTMILFPCVYFNTNFGDTPAGE